MRKKFTTTIDDEILKQLKIQAIKEGLDVSKLIEKIFLGYLQSLNKKES